MSTVAAHTPNGGQTKQLKSSWGWFVALGIGMIIAGFVASANLFASTLASVLFIAGMMFAGAVMQLVHAFTQIGWRRRIFNLIGGIFYAVASLVIIYDPVLSAVDISFVIGALLIATGVMRIAVGVRDRSHRGWGWIVASGVGTVLVGAVVVVTWPAVGLWLLGGFLTVDLIFQGWAFLAFGFALRQQ